MNKKLRVLLVDDDKEEYILTQDLLADRSYFSEQNDPVGFELDWVFTYDDALAAFEKDQHDVYLVDYHLGQRDGLELLREANARHLKAPVILMTGFGSYELDIEAMNYGATDYLSKDEVNAPLLERTIRYAIERKRTEDVLRRAHDELEMRVRERTRELARANAELRAEIIEREKAETVNTTLYKDLQSALAQEQAMRTQLIQSEKFVAMGRMVASVAHELNNPLQIIKNCLFLTKQEIPAEKSFHEYLDMALSETQRVSNLVTQLRELYRPQVSLPQECLELNNLLEEVRALLAPQLLNQNVLWQQAERSAPVMVKGIADQLKQVFLNIGVNAIEAMKPGGGRLEVSLVTDVDRGRVGVVFKDSGPGITAEIIENLFEPFFTTKPSGLGLGLSICYEIVERHGGVIAVDSQLGQGATFTVWLPLILQPEVKGETRQG